MNDAVIMTKYSRRKFFKKAARELLFSQWIMQVLAFLIVGGCCIGIDQFGVSVAQLVFYLFDNLRLAELFNVVYFVISVAVSIPLFYGLLYFEIGAVSGKANLADLFVAFSDISLLNRSYILFFYTFLKCLIFYLPALVLFLFLDWYYYNGI